MNKSHFRRWLISDYSQAFLAGLITSIAFRIADWVNKMHYSELGLNTPIIQVLVSLFIILVAGTLVITIFKKMGNKNSQEVKFYQIVLRIFCFFGGYYFVALVIIFWVIISMVVRLFF